MSSHADFSNVAQNFRQSELSIELGTPIGEPKSLIWLRGAMRRRRCYFSSLRSAVKPMGRRFGAGARMSARMAS